MDICDVYDFDFLINKFIRILENKLICLDVIFINVFVFMRDFGIIEIGLSDYCFVYIVLNMKLLWFRLESIFKRLLKNFD